MYWSDAPANIYSFLSKTGIMLFPCSLMETTCKKECCIQSIFPQESKEKLGNAFCYFFLWKKWICSKWVWNTKITKEISSTKYCNSLRIIFLCLPYLPRKLLFSHQRILYSSHEVKIKISVELICFSEWNQILC